MEHIDTHTGWESGEDSPTTPRKIPNDLPTSLDDRRNFDTYTGETEIYDAWQGEQTRDPR